MEKGVRKARKIKISIVDEGKHINIPGIPFWLINFLVDLGLGLGSIAIKFAKDIDEDAKKILNAIDRKDIKLLIRELKNNGPFDLVKVSEGHGTKVKISIL